MNPWSTLVSGLQSLLTWTSTSTGLSLGVSIFLVTFVVRAVLVPITYPLAMKSRAWQRAYRAIRPRVKEARVTHKADPRRSMKEVEQLYADAGIKIADTSGVIAAFVQLPVLICFFQAVLHLSEGSALAAPSILLGLVAGALSFVSTAVGGMTESKPFMVVSALLPIGIVMWLGSGIGYYLAGFYAASCIQSWLMKRAITTERAAGA